MVSIEISKIKAGSKYMHSAQIRIKVKSKCHQKMKKTGKIVVLLNSSHALYMSGQL